MIDLTEQWKEGELDIGEVYYVKTERGVYKANGEYLNSASCIYGFDISYIIAPVPTYSEYLAVAKQLELAVEALKYYGNEDKWADCDTLSCLCDYGYKFAQEALKQIEELDK